MTASEIWAAVERMVERGEQTFICNALSWLEDSRQITKDQYQKETARLGMHRPARYWIEDRFGRSQEWPGCAWFPVTPWGKARRLEIIQRLKETS